MLDYRFSCPGEPSFPSLQLLRELRTELLGALHPECDCEDIAWFHSLHKWLIERPHKGKWIRYWLRDTLSFKEPVLAQVDGSFHLHGRKVEPNCDRQVITGPQRCVYLLLEHPRQARLEPRVVSR